MLDMIRSPYATAPKFPIFDAVCEDFAPGHSTQSTYFARGHTELVVGRNGSKLKERDPLRVEGGISSNCQDGEPGSPFRSSPAPVLDNTHLTGLYDFAR